MGALDFIDRWHILVALEFELKKCADFVKWHVRDGKSQEAMYYMKKYAEINVAYEKIWRGYI